MSNILLNKPATASSFVAPYSASRAVDGTTGDPRNRWVSCQLPAGLMIDLQNNYWVNQWILNMMGSVGWPANCNMSDFKLQGSLDNAIWFDIDTVANNSANQINRNIANPRLVRFLRVVITKGLIANNAVSSIVEFQAFEPATAPFLSNLVPSTSALIPGFSSRILSYTMNVPSDLGSITFTPSALQSNMAIKVNGTAVVSGQASQAISLNPGNNPVVIDVTSADGTMKTTYNVGVVRLAPAAYLSGLVIKTNRNADVIYSPALADGILNYSASVASGVASVILTPSAVNATILVNGTEVASGTASTAIPLVSGTNTITIKVTSAAGGIGNYVITITKG